MEISISIVTYNSENIIEFFLKDLISKTLSYKPKIFIVDNCSTDNTVTILKRFKEEFGVNLVLQSINKGFGYGHNQILNKINSNFHIILNPDIFLTSVDSISKLINFLNKYPSIGMVSPKLIGFDNKEQALLKFKPSFFDFFIRFFIPKYINKKKTLFGLKSGFYHVDFLSGAFLFLRTELFRKIGGFDENFFMYLEDADLTHRVNKISQSVYLPEITVVHKWERMSHKKFRFFKIMIQSVFYYYRKWGFILF
jgi:GT2 family glycosyltransferase